jgi:outer membrane protein OmpA-like peptidoglycan-associated protein
MARKLIVSLAIATLAATSSTLGCQGEVNLSAGTPQPPPPPPPAPTPEPPPPPAPPAAPAPIAVKAVGKAQIQGDQVKMPGEIEFDNNKATIRDTKQTQEILTTLRDFLKENPNVTKLRIEGHTDTVGTHEFNMKLSQGRAEAVKAWLVKNGIDAKRIETVGLGETRPEVKDEKTEEDRQRNRRTEFHVIEIDGKPVGATAAPAPPGVTPPAPPKP